MSKINIIPIFVPHLGCPNDCVFCNQRRITGVGEFSIENFEEKLNFFLDLFKDSNKEIELAFYGGSFTAIDRNLQYKLLDKAKDEKLKGNIDRIRISTRPDCIDENILNYLKEYNVDIIELGVQSLDADVLFLSKRGHNREAVFKSSKLIKNYGFKLGLQQMIGLPGDNKEKSIKTALEIISLEPDFVRIYPTLVIKNTELEELFNQKMFEPLSLNDAVSIVTELILLYEFSGIDIARVGLQSTPELQFQKDVISGPLHDAFRELCESEKLLLIIKSKEITINGAIEVYANNRNISLLVGQKGINKDKIKKLLNVSSIAFYSDKTISNDKIIFKNDSHNVILDLKEETNKIVKGWNNVFKEH